MIEICAMDSFGNPVGIDKFPECVPSSNYWYLHGQLETDVGFDLALFTIDNKDLMCDQFILKKNNKIIKREEFYYLPERIYDVKVIGFDKPCKGYFWTQSFNLYLPEGIHDIKTIEFNKPCKDYFCTKSFNLYKTDHLQRGLVVYADDKEANDYAYECFKEKSKII